MSSNSATGSAGSRCINGREVQLLLAQTKGTWNLDRLKPSIRAGLEVTPGFGNGRTALYFRIYKDKPYILQVPNWIQGAHISAKDEDSDGWTPLHHARRAGRRSRHVDIVLKRGVNISARTTDGAAALHSAISGGNK